MLRDREAWLVLTVVATATVLLLIAAARSLAFVAYMPAWPSGPTLLVAGVLAVVLLLAGLLLRPEWIVRAGLLALVLSAAAAAFGTAVATTSKRIEFYGSTPPNPAWKGINFAVLVLAGGFLLGLAWLAIGGRRRGRVPDTTESSVPLLPRRLYGVIPYLLLIPSALVLHTAHRVWSRTFVPQEGGWWSQAELVPTLFALGGAGVLAASLLIVGWALESRPKPPAGDDLPPALPFILEGRFFLLSGVGTAAWLLGRVPIVAAEVGSERIMIEALHALDSGRRWLLYGICLYLALYAGAWLTRWVTITGRREPDSVDTVIGGLCDGLPVLGVAVAAGSLLYGLLRPVEMPRAVEFGSMTLLAAVATGAVGAWIVRRWIGRVTRS